MEIKELRLTYHAERNFPNLIVRQRKFYEGNVLYSLLCRIRKLTANSEPYNCVNAGEFAEVDKARIQFMKPIVGKNGGGYIKERVVDDIRPPCIRCEACDITKIYKKNSQT